MNRKQLIAVVLLLCTTVTLCACGRRTAPDKNDTVAPTPTALTIQTPTPSPSTDASSSQAEIVTPEPTPTPIPTPSPTPANLPIVTKNPTDETVIVNGTCLFVAKYQNAIWAVWHFVSPDGTRDLGFEVAQKEFPTLKIIDGGTNILTLQNIPETLNGWKVYCEFSNNSGKVNTEKAKITVTIDTTSGSPKVTKDPTSENVDEGGSAYFVSKQEGAIWAVWHFVSPDGTRDLTYSDAANEFPAMKIINGDQTTMQLQNIPASMNGWRVYCAFQNNVGSVNTNPATVTVGTQTVPQNTNTSINIDTAYSAIYNGLYVESIAKRATMSISGGPEVFNVSITWPNGYAESSSWTFSGSFNGRAVLNYSNCTKTTTTYDNAGNPTVVTDYTSGTGYIQLSDAGAVWVDNVANAGNGATFIKQ